MIKQANKQPDQSSHQKENVKTSLSFIARQVLTQIQQFLPHPAPHTYSSFFYNHQKVFNLIREVLTNCLSHDHPFLPTTLLTKLTAHYAPSAILYAVLTHIFQQPIDKINFEAEERHRFFLTSHPTRPTVILEAFINILEEQTVSSLENVVTILSRIEKLLQESLQQIRNDKDTLKVTREETVGRVGYRSTIIIDAASKIYQPNDLIYSSSPDSMNQVFFEGLYNAMKSFGELQAKRIVEELLLLIGAIVFMETAQLQQIKKGIENKREFPMEMPFYGNLVCIKNFSLDVRFLSTVKDTTTLELAITFPSQVVTVPTEEFQLKMQALWVSLGKVTQKRLSVQNHVYLLDMGNQVGQGSFGKVFRCQSIQLINQEHHETTSTRSLYFHRSHLAGKQLKLTAKEQIKMEIPANREHLILGLLGQLRHRQMIKSVRREIGIQTEETLVGLQSIIPLLDCFRLQIGHDGRKRVEQHYYLIFPLANFSLSTPQFLQPLFGSQMFQQQVSLLFQRVFEGLACLHFQLGRLYPYQLNRYYLLQNSDDGNSERDHLPFLIPGGKNGICLRDVKPSNIVVQVGAGSRVVKVWLIDFGMARIGELSVRSGATNCGSDYYMAPEVRQGLRQDERVDVWSAAVTLLEIIGKGSRLYNSLEFHSMKETIQTIQQRINLIVGSQQAWAVLLKATLAPNIQASSEKTPIRLNSLQVVQFMQRQTWHLRGRPLLDSFYSNNQRYIFKEANGNVMVEQWDGVSEQHMKVSQHCLRDLMRHAAGSPKYSLKALLVCFYHVQIHFSPSNRLQLIYFLTNLHLLTLSSSDSKNFIISPIVPPQQEVRLDSTILDDMQQTVFFGQITGGNPKLVMLATHVIFREFSTKTQVACHQNNIKYFNGYCMSEQPNKMRSELYTIDNFREVKEYTGKERLFSTKNILGEVDVLFFKKAGQTFIQLKDVKDQELVEIVNQIENFMIIQAKDNIITIDLLLDQIQEPNFVHLFRISRVNNQPKVAFNAKALLLVLNGGGLCVGVKEAVKQVLKLKMKMTHEIRLGLCAYLNANSGADFNNILQKALQISQEKLISDLKQFLSGLSDINYLPATTFIKKGTAATAKIVRDLHSLVVQQFGPLCNTISKKTNRSFEAGLRQISNYCHILLQMKANQWKLYERGINLAAFIGKRVVQHLQFFKFLLTIN